jgi:PKD repeat protein
VASGTPTFGGTPLQVQFTGSSSTGGPLTYAWDLDGDGQFDDSTAANPSWTYTTPGSVTATLKVTATANGVWDIARVTVTTEARPVAHISAPATSLTWSVGSTITFAGSATDAEDGTEPPSRLAWTITVKHCPSACHDHILQTLTGAGGSFAAPDHDYPSQLDIKLVATDAAGVASAPVVVTIQPKKAGLSFATSPTGITIGVGGVNRVAPFSKIAIVGSAVQVAAPLTVTVAGTTYYFKSWSDGFPATHTVTAKVGLPTLTAIYGTRLRSRHGLVAT